MTEPAGTRQSTGRLELARAVVVTAVGALLILLASGREWARTTVAVPAGPRATVTATGHAVEAALPALGIALLALAGAIIAGRGVLRRIVGVVTALAAAAAVAVAIAGRGHVSKTLTGHEPDGLGIAVHASANAWWLVAVVGGTLALVAGVLTALRGSSWAAMGAKYETPPTEPVTVAAGTDDWDALDRGEDPTT